MNAELKNKKANLIELFIDKIITEKNLSNSTVNTYNTDLKLFNSFLEKNKLDIFICKEITLNKWVEFLVLNNMKTSTRLRKISVIRQFFSFLFKEKFIMANPSLNLVLPKKEKTIPKFLDENDISKLLNWMRNNSNTFKDLQTLILTEVLYATGLRVSELVKLKISALSDDLTSVHITGKGNKDRVLPIGEYAQILLKEYLYLIKDLKKSNSAKSVSWLFPGRKSHITRQAFFMSLKSAAKKACINTNKISPHILRHAFASHMLKNGADLKVIQHLLGHEDISTVEIYTHVDIDETKKALKKHPLAKLDI